jgi:glycosyltransferase involved in cell wall biosynthesis
MFERDVEDLARQMQAVEDDPEMAADYRRHAPERIRQAYGWDRITDQYEDFFYHLVQSRAHSQAMVLPARDS